MVKQGYKPTEIGVIPEDWEVKAFKDVTRLITCGIAATPNYVNESLGKTFLSSTNVKKGKIDFENVKYIPLQLHNQLYKNNPPEKGDILYTRVGAVIGEAAVVNVDYEFSIYVSLTLIKEKKAILNNYYLMHLLNSIKYENLAYNTVLLGGGVGNLNVNVVREFPIILPPLAEQEAIATALSDADAWIERLEQLIAKKRLIKQGAMQELLTPPSTSSGNADGEALEPWEVKKLGEVCEIKRGQIITSSDRIDGDIPVIAGGKTPAYYHNKANRIGKTITISASGASAGYVGFHNYPIFASDSSTISESDKYVIEFIYYFLVRNQDLIYSFQTGGAQPHIHAKDVEPMIIGIPSLFEQERIATILSDMDAELEALEQKLSKARQIKQGMMQELLTGRVRLV